MPTIQEELEAIAYKYAYGVIESVLLARGGQSSEVAKLREDNTKLARENERLQKTVRDLLHTPVKKLVGSTTMETARAASGPAEGSEWRDRDGRRNGVVRRVVGVAFGKVVLRPTTDEDETGPLSRVKLENFYRRYMPADEGA